jgi:SAM-dependent methyltransferase
VDARRSDTAAPVTPADGWSVLAPLAPGGDAHTEEWELWRAGERLAALPVRVRVGKPLDVRRLRPVDPAGSREYLRGLEADAAALRAGGLTARPDCPCCGAAAADAAPEVTVTGMAYVRCPACRHLYVGRQPTPEALRHRFATADDLAGVYTDAASLEVRMAQVVRPKLAWALDAAARDGRGAESLVDLGAGGGHFVAAARQAGLRATGYELSAASCAFAREVLGVELVRGDAMAAEPGEPADLVTLWGVLEYVPEPRAFVRQAARHLAPGGLLVAEVPRADALSAALAGAFPGTVTRHLEPTSHLNVFSDASLATLLWDAGFAPVAAWYFGMDAYELLSQLALRVPAEAAEALAVPLLGLQDALDRARLCDDVIVAAVRR